MKYHLPKKKSSLCLLAHNSLAFAYRFLQLNLHLLSYLVISFCLLSAIEAAIANIKSMFSDADRKPWQGRKICNKINMSGLDVVDWMSDELTEWNVNEIKRTKNNKKHEIDLEWRTIIKMRKWMYDYTFFPFLNLFHP